MVAKRPLWDLSTRLGWSLNVRFGTSQRGLGGCGRPACRARPAARQVVFLVSGEGKRQALSRLLDPDESPERTPAKLVQPGSEILVLADQAASEGL